MIVILIIYVLIGLIYMYILEWGGKNTTKEAVEFNNKEKFVVTTFWIYFFIKSIKNWFNS
jgi:hypothetical protein